MTNYYNISVSDYYTPTEVANFINCISLKDINVIPTFSYCADCYMGETVERVFDDKKAYDKLSSIGKEMPPPGVSMQAHLNSALFKFPNENFYTEIKIECPNKDRCPKNWSKERVRNI